MRTTIPNTNKIKTSGACQPKSEAKLTPITRQAKPIIDSNKDSKSIFGLVIFPTFGKPVMANPKAITKNGINNQKIHCQDNLPKIIPVMVGPIAGANIMTKAQTPIALPIL